MNALEKIKRSWWVLFSLLFYFNGLGFIYIGVIHRNRNWVLEGLIYEIPWIFLLIFLDFESISGIYIAISLILMLVSIVRSFWVAIKLGDVYDNEDKYALQTTNLNNQNITQDNSDFPTTLACASCMVLIFVVYALIAFGLT